MSCFFIKLLRRQDRSPVESRILRCIHKVWQRAEQIQYVVISTYASAKIKSDVVSGAMHDGLGRACAGRQERGRQDGLSARAGKRRSVKVDQRRYIDLVNRA